MIQDYTLNFLFKKFHLTALSVSLISLFLFILIIPWAFTIGVWDKIDYPLSASYTAVIGDIFLGISNYFIICYYLSSPKFFHHLLKPQYSLSIFILSISISILFHLMYLQDSLHGWTEISATGGFSLLGYYHLTLFGIELSIILNFFVSVVLNIKKLWTIDILNKSEIDSIESMTRSMIYTLFLLSIYLSILIFTFTQFAITHNSIFLQNIMVFFMYFPIYILSLPLLTYFYTKKFQRVKIRVRFLIFLLICIVVLQNILLTI